MKTYQIAVIPGDGIGPEVIREAVKVLTDYETFCYAFNLGAKIVLDVLADGQMREI